MYINISKVDFGRCYSGGSPGGEEYYGMYITPADASAISVTPYGYYYRLHGKYLKFSTDGKEWFDLNVRLTIKPGQKMYLKGEDDYVWNSSTNGKLFETDGYYNVGGDISSLTNEIVDVKDYTFSKLFSNDNYIKDASSLILPANTLASYCYSWMFFRCYSLTAVPSLTATTLAEGCYYSMFNGCTSLTTAPELPATTLAGWCYQNIFYKCSNINNITMLATDISATNCLNDWVSGVSATGTFTKSPEMTTLPTGTSGIPEGWTVVDYGAA